MNKKFMQLICLAATVSLLLYGCQKSTDTTGGKNLKTVETMILSPSKYDVKLSYQGIVKSSETRNYFFTSSGKVSEVYIKEGQYVKKGDILATLDTTQLNFLSASKHSNLVISENTLEKTISTYDTNITNAEAGIEILKQTITAAESNLDVLKSTLEANETLYEAGAISQKSIESQRAQYAKSEVDFTSLCSQLETAQANLEKLKKDKVNDINIEKENVAVDRNSMEQAEQNIIDATLRAEADGYITKLDISEGDSVTANSPVITAKSNSSMVSIGVSAEDYNKLPSVKQVIINNSITGQIDNISIHPDETTNTYAVDIIFSSDNVVIGEIVVADLVLDSVEGVFVPIESVINLNGVNYVYKLNDDSTVSRVRIDIKEISESKMLVSNLFDEKIIITGIKTLNDNDVVSEINQTDSHSQNGGLDD
ncbi:HlyD family secretion protein [Anaerovirgula multivorans]|uniref:HlyD family secretion protein n=1 Tax=Anaerovirgula multivorans TaxID=312168 RepID=A0A239GI04_9FIRM|nr:biotin/lipoyl-binding protein [Anaerovirgula multivorans]SNS68769.1 HlyD family secretion protein [Anaerovirgula multivorans]